MGGIKIQLAILLTWHFSACTAPQKADGSSAHQTQSGQPPADREEAPWAAGWGAPSGCAGSWHTNTQKTSKQHTKSQLIVLLLIFKHYTLLFSHLNWNLLLFPPEIHIIKTQTITKWLLILKIILHNSLFTNLFFNNIHVSVYFTLCSDNCPVPLYLRIPVYLISWNNLNSKSNKWTLS